MLRPLSAAFAKPKNMTAEFNTATWTKNSVNTTANAALSPDGKMNAFRVVQNAANDYHFIKKTVGTFATGTTYVIAAYLKAYNGQQWCYMDNSFTASVYFDLANGVLGNLGSAVTASKIRALADGWYFVAIQFTGENVSNNFAITTATANGANIVHAGNNSTGFYVWKASCAPGILHDLVGGGEVVDFEYIQELDFESPTNTFMGLNVEAITGGVTRETTIVKHGSGSAKFYINKADTGFGGGANPHRSEIHSLEEEYEFNEDYWFGFSQYYQDWSTDPAAEQIWQFHNVPNFGAGETWGTLKLQTPFGCQVQNNRFLLKHSTSNTASNPNSPVTVSTIDIGAVPSNTWVDWVVHCRFHYSTGLIEVWKDGVLVYTKSGNTYYNDENGPYHKMGIYKWSWVHPEDNSIVTTRTMYVDDWRIAKGPNVEYADVAPRS